MAVEEIDEGHGQFRLHVTGKDVWAPEFVDLYKETTEEDKQRRVDGDHPGHKPIRGTLLFEPARTRGRWEVVGVADDGRFIYADRPPNCRYEKVDGGYVVVS